MDPNGYRDPEILVKIKMQIECANANGEVRNYVLRTKVLFFPFREGELWSEQLP